MKYCEHFSTKKLLKECGADFQNLRDFTSNNGLSKYVLDLTGQREEELQEKVAILKYLSRKYDFELPYLIPEIEDFLEYLEEIRVIHGLLFTAKLRYNPIPF